MKYTTLSMITMVFMLTSSCQNSGPETEYATIPGGDVVFAPRHYVCYFAPEKPVVDGLLDDDAWSLVPWTEDFKDIEGDSKPTPRYRTHAKMLWDDQYLYIAAELEEPDIWATLRQRDTVIFYDNDFEVFIDPDGDTHQYYEFEMNAFGTEWDLMLVKPYRDGGPALNGWDMNGIQVGVHIYGTINEPETKDEKWTIEIAMPWNILKEAAHEYRKPMSGEQWRISFSRVEWEVEVVDGTYIKKTDPNTGRPLPENNWVWSPQGLVNMHLPELWGFVQFTDIPAGSGEVAFKENPEENIKWELRQWYYKQSRYFEEHGQYAAMAQDLLDESVKEGELPAIETTSQMYEMSLPAVEPGKRWYIRQDGKVWKK